MYYFFLRIYVEFSVERLKVRWKTLRDGFVRHLKKKKALEMYTAAAAMRPYKLEKQISFLLPHVSFREDDEGGSMDEDTSSLMDKTVGDSDLPCEQPGIDDLIFDQSVMEKNYSECDALDRSIHFLCDQRYKPNSMNYRYGINCMKCNYCKNILGNFFFFVSDGKTWILLMLFFMQWHRQSNS